MEYILLGLVQGLTEFLPVSSQGHLLLIYRLFHLTENIAFDTVLHLATALAAIVYFRRDIFDLFTSNRRLLWLVAAATFFTGLIGLSFKDFFESLFLAFEYVGPFFIVTGLVILAGEWAGKSRRGAERANFFDAAIIGIAQGMSIVPSLSRSAMTISSALALNLDRRFAATFSFLVSIPAILGAGFIQSKAIFKAGTIGIGIGPLALGFLAAFISGWFAIKIFMGVIQKTSLRVFAYYCIILGVAVVLLTYFKVI